MLSSITNIVCKYMFVCVSTVTSLTHSNKLFKSLCYANYPILCSTKLFVILSTKDYSTRSDWLCKPILNRSKTCAECVAY